MMSESSTNLQSWKISSQRTIDLDRPFLIGIMNVTPDSFSDGGEIRSVRVAVDRAKRMIDEGADGIDIGGESTRPGAERVSEDEQIARVVPIVRAIRDSGIDVLMSVDTTRGRVAREAIESGADVINDVSGGREDETMFGLMGELGCGIVLMHRVVEPGQDRYSDQYDVGRSGEDGGRPINYGVVDRVCDELGESRDRAISAGVDPRSIVLDPGLGFGKDVEQNLELIRGTGQLLRLGCPVMSALSKKSFVGRVSLDRDSSPDERVWGTVGLSAGHLMMGAMIFRVHDVGVHREALDGGWALKRS